MAFDRSRLASEPWRLDAVELAQLIRAKELSCFELAQSFLQRINSINPTLNAIVKCDQENVFNQARSYDQLIHQSPELIGVLGGIPITFKLNVDVIGDATSNGVRGYLNRVALKNSPVVDNLLGAGAINIGRTNVPPFSMRWFSECSIYGRTLNPWDPKITSGGSSGGAAVAVATGMCSISHGTDIGGSIRYPAYVNGVVGLRTTPGRVPAVSSTVPLRFAGLQLCSSQGPLGRSVRDVRLAFDVMRQNGSSDPTWIDHELSYPDDLTPVRVGLVDEFPGVMVDPQVKDALKKAAASLADAGYQIEPVKVPGLEETIDIWLSIIMSEVHVGMQKDVDALDDVAARNAIRAMSDCADSFDLPTYARALGARDALRQEWSKLMDLYPLLLVPSSCKLPLTWDADQGGRDVMFKLLRDQSPLIAPATLGLPGLSVPVGLVEGKPIGVQLVAKSHREYRLLAAGAVIEASAKMPRFFEVDQQSK